MNHHIIYLSFVVIPCILSSCQSGTETENSNSISVFDSNSIPNGEPAIICGTIHNLEVYPHIKEVILDIPDFKGYENVHTALISPDGSFYFKINPVIAREISLYPVADIIIVRPGDSIHIDKDFKKNLEIEFTGNSIELNTHANKFLSEYYLGRYRVENNNVTEYREYCDDYRKESLTNLNAFAQKNDCSEEFLNWAKTTIDNDYYIALLSYSSQLIRNMDDKDKKNIKENRFYDFLDSLESNFNKNIICSNYYNLIESYQNKYIMPLIVDKYMGEPKRNQIRDSLFLDEISQFSNNDMLNQFVLSNQYNQFLTNHFSDLFEDNVNILNRTIKEPFLLKTLSDRYKHLKDYITNPEYLSNAMLGETDFMNESVSFTEKNPIRNYIIKDLISNNDNKVIYLDFWGPSCPTCIPELIESKKLQAKYKGRAIKFIYICLSDSITGKKIIKENEIGGDHYYLNPSESSYYQNMLGINGIPNYLLIDRNGTIVDYGTIIRPSYPGTQEKIESLINE